ncbi:cysteinyl-tRNA synthetase [Achromatium sp. WMS1]|nr:cysteinyl-tRNA synthetase [Achromatium sp. WMS1]
MLHIYNSLTRSKTAFTPITPGKVGLYVCGMTVYDYCHLGHARVMVAFDVVYRYLQALGYQVTYVRNITDIDDKIINRANELGKVFTELTEQFIQAFHEDEKALNVLPPTHEPRATSHIPQILDMIHSLIERGYAYVTDDGDVRYSVKAFPRYGQLSGKSLDELKIGARVKAVEAKNDPFDFVLWKSAKPGEPAWNSPWGNGRPGWHIECSAMSTHCLGKHFDIHGGGADLQFPHHENEIAQSEGAYGETFVNIWMHNGFVQIDDEKMAKSSGNFFTIREVLQRYRPEEVRYFIISSHYRSPLNYADAQIQNAKTALTKLYTALRGLAQIVVSVVSPTVNQDVAEDFSIRFYAAMDDDFNTPLAVAVLFDLAHEINRVRTHNLPQATILATKLRQLGNILGILQDDPDAFLQGSSIEDGLADTKIMEFIQQRTTARQAKDWAEADRIRNLLKQQGILLEDNANGTSWRRI